MPNWKGPRYESGWIYRRVSWETWEEMEQYDQVDGASFDKSVNDSLKTGGSISYDESAPDEVDLLIAYYEFTDENGEHVMHPVATVQVEAESPEFRSLANGTTAQSGTLKAYSVLKVLSDMKCRKTVVIPAGTNAIARAVEIVEGAGLRTNSPSSNYVTKNDKPFEPTDSWLTVVNWLLDAAGYASAYDDAFGVVQMTRYVEPTERPLVWVFRNDNESTLGFGVVEENDRRSIPNVYTVNYSSDTVSLSATARNVDPTSRASLPSRGWREKGESETIEELEGSTVQEMIENLKAIAISRIKSKSSEINKAKFSTFYVPVNINDAVGVDYSDKVWRGCITDMGITANPAGDTDIEIRNFIHHDLKVEVECEILWEVNA